MNTARNVDSDIANTILAQLGGSRFTAMTGAKSFSVDRRCLIFKLPLTAGFVRDGISAVRITLEDSDLYTLSFYRQAPAPAFEVTLVHEAHGVDAEQLATVFEDTTGLRTSLGSR